ncbi:hypothetical protein Tco_1089775, partial [Tanacetum coccineum]
MSSYSIPHGSTNHSSCSTCPKISRFKLDTQDIMYAVDMFRDTIQPPVETPDNPFVAPVNIEIIESFMHTVGYQGVVDK